MEPRPRHSDLDPFLRLVALPPGWRIVYEPVVTSTMDLAREAARRGWPSGSVFVADVQTAGRGRHGRSWLAPGGRALLFTVLLRGAEPTLLTSLASVALAETVERLAGLEPAIKWPNDLLIGRRKLAGVLAESFSGPPADYTLVGCGLNVNQSADELAELGRPATSLCLEAGRPFHRGELLAVFVEQAADWLARPREARPAALRQAWQERLWGQGQLLRFRDQADEFQARLEGVDQDGALLVRLTDGQPRRILAGEIVIDAG